MTNAGLPAALFARLRQPFTGEAVFDALPDVVFFIKDQQARYVVVNQTLVDRCGVADKEALIGRTPRELFPAPLGSHYYKQDIAVIASGTPMLNHLEVHLYSDGATGWCLTQKLPLAGLRGETVGLVGISRDLLSPRLQSPDYAAVATVVTRIQLRLSDPLSVAGLAAEAKLSPYRLDQRMQRVFNLSTAQFIQKSRLDEALRRLRNTSDPVAKIAIDCGYADHSAFTRSFKRTVGVSPAEFRRVQQSS